MALFLRLIGAIMVLLVGAFASADITAIVPVSDGDDADVLPAKGKKARSFCFRLPKFKRPEVKVALEWHDMPDLPKPEVKERVKQLKSALPKPQVKRPEVKVNMQIRWHKVKAPKVKSPFKRRKREESTEVTVV